MGGGMTPTTGLSFVGGALTSLLARSTWSVQTSHLIYTSTCLNKRLVLHLCPDSLDGLCLSSACLCLPACNTPYSGSLPSAVMLLKSPWVSSSLLIHYVLWCCKSTCCRAGMCGRQGLIETRICAGGLPKHGKASCLQAKQNAWLYLQVRPPMPFVHFFLIDVSYNAVTSGALEATCSAIARILDELQGVPPPLPPVQLLLFALLLPIALNWQPAVQTAHCKTQLLLPQNTASMQLLKECSHQMHSGLRSFAVSLHGSRFTSDMCRITRCCLGSFT